MAPTTVATNNAAAAASSNRVMYLVMGLGFLGAFMLGGMVNEQEAFQISDMNLKSSVSQSASHVWNTVTSYKTGSDGSDLSSDFSKKVKDATVTPKRKGASKMNQERIDAVRTEVKTVLDMLDKYYKVDSALLSAKEMLVDQGWSRGWDFSKPANHTKPTREMKLIDTMARALVDPTQDTFIIGTIGSSVAAGHDNCVYDSYENQLMRTFSKVWEAASMKLEIQNAGQGGGCGDSHENQVWCIQQNVSPFVDIIHYSWTYFEAGIGGKVERESLIRWAQLMPRQPPVHALNVGGAYDDKLKPGDVTRCYGSEGDLFDGYEDYGHNAFCMRHSIVNMWKNKSKSCFQGGFVGDFLHTTTRYGALETNQERKNSLGVVMRNWHPGPLGFQAVADGFTYTYSLAILGALDLIEEALHAKKDIVKLWTNERPIMLRSHFRDPLHCDPLYCTVEEAPTCLNYELPTFGWYGASLTPTHDNLNPYRGELQNWTIWHQDTEGPFRMVPKPDQVFYASTPEFCTFPDHCGGLSATHGQEGRAVFKLPKMEVGLLVVCGCCGKEVGKDMFLENEFIEIEFNNERLHNNTWDIWPNGKCVRLLKTHLEDGADIGNNGHSYLSIKVKPGLKEPIRISHVITH